MTRSDIAARLASDLLALGVRPGGVLMVHSSRRSLGELPQGAETAVLGLVEALGASGTLLMPALSYTTVGPGRPHFDARTTPSCVGALTEYFRNRPGTLRSTHPTHSVCGLGARAAELLAGHENDTTPCGPNSPFHKLRGAGGQVLFIGCGLAPNTSMHAIEELSAPPYLYAALTTYECRDMDGRTHSMTVRNHGFARTIQRYDRLQALLGPPDLRTGQVLDAPCHLVECPPMWSVADDKLRAAPLYFVDTEPAA